MTTKELKASATRLLEENILSFWITRMTDHERGGYYGQMTGDGRLVKDADKGAILNARLLWTFSAAYRVLGKQEYLDAASRAYNYFIDHFIDHEYGGVYWSVDCNGNALDTKKQFYAIGFAVYGMSEYVRATGSREALDIALQLYDCIEEHSFDHENNGYIEASTREWGEMADMRLSAKDENYPKSQNTHLHIIEPYANLYRCLKELRADESVILRVGNSLRVIIDLFTEKILNPETNHLDLFFDMDWRRMSRDESYGHDIECSWLLHEAALVLGDKDVLRRVEPVVMQVAKASEKGLNNDGSMCYEWKVDGGMDTARHWWVQAENVVGWLNIYQHFGDAEALRRAQHCYKYILDNLVDDDGGEWFWSCAPDGTPNRRDDKAGFWKCPYHNGRMCLEIIERYETL